MFSLLIFAPSQTYGAKQLFNKKIVTVKSLKRSVSKTFYAVTRYDESKIIDITLRFSGFIEHLYADKRYMFIKKHQKLFTIYSNTLARIQTERILARQNGQRGVVKNLQKRLDLMKTGYTISSDYTVDITAPFSGIVVEKKVNTGSFVKEGSLILRMADTSQMWVLFQIYQKDLSFVQPGLSATVNIQGLPPVKSKVAYIYPVVDPKTKKVDARVVLDNPNGKIFPNMFAKVTVHQPPRHMLVLPVSAVLTKGEKHFVFKALEGGDYEPVEIDAKRLDSRTYQIFSGLKEGDRVIDKALFMLDADAMTNGLYDTDEEEW
jgi:Cu(I)/Ag(I) efflux system membrane fusion protein